nr:nucleotide-binding alpha-beta plait domain-containing protein [Tanacetum cinerariifolium]
LCTVWMDRFKIHANIARFQRPMVKKEGVRAKKPFVVPTPTDQTKNIANEGFTNIVTKYMGELWVMLEFKSASSVLKFKESIGAMSWFSQVTEVTNEFEVKGRIAWIKVEGVPFSKSIQEEFKILNRGKVYWIRASETPRWVPDFTDDTEDDDINSMDEGDTKHKPDDSDINNDKEKVPDTCFEEEEEVKSPVYEKNSENNLENSEDPFNIQSLLNLEVRPDNIVEANDAQSECCEANKLKGNGNSLISSGHFKDSEAPRSGGSMIGLLEEVVKVGQVMGFKMDGCISNMEEIIGSQGVEDGYR